MAKVMKKDVCLNYLPDRLRSLSISISSNARCIYLSTTARHYVSKVQDDSVQQWPHMLGIGQKNLHITGQNHLA